MSSAATALARTDSVAARRRRPLPIRKVGAYLLLAVVSVLVAFPLLLALSYSFMSEFDIASVKPEMRAVVTVDALGGEALAGGVTFAAPTGNDSGGVVTFRVHVALNRAAGLKPGMTANVRIIVAQRKQVIRVPLDAVTEDSKGDSVVTIVEQGGKHTTRKVELGLANDTDVEIVTGLREGEQIAGPKQEPSQGKAP